MFFDIPKRKRKPYVWDGRKDYSMRIIYDEIGSVNVLAGTFADLKKAANQKVRELKKAGHKKFLVEWEDFPDEMTDTVLNTFFSWENT